MIKLTITALTLLMGFSTLHIKPKAIIQTSCNMSSWYIAELETEAKRKNWALKKLREARERATKPAPSLGYSLGKLSIPYAKMPTLSGFINKIRYQREIVAAATKYDLEPAFVAAVIKHESGFNPKARSHCGAIGLGQLMPATAAKLGVNPYDPLQNIEGTAKYLAQLSAMYKGNKKLTLAAYNAGPGAVAKYKGIPNYAETKKYVPCVLAHYERFKKEVIV